MGTRDLKLVELNKISKSYGSLKVLKEISLFLSAGEIVSILGPSGCGKTTLLNIIAGLIPQDKGEVRVAKGKRVGYVFQEPRLLPWRNVEDNILFVQKNYPIKEDLAKQVRDKLICMAGMRNFIHRFPSQLSGGMKQRVSLIRALSILPHILLLDEPFKSIDRETASVIEGTILNMWRREIEGIIMVTHDWEIAFRLSTRVYVLSQRPARVLKKLNYYEIEKFSTDWREPLFVPGSLEKGLSYKSSLRRGSMKLRTIIDKLGFKNWTPELGNDIEITGCHISDVMSDTLANASEGDLWLTRQNNQVVIALASLKKIPAVVLVDGKQPVPEVLERAKGEGVIVLSTSMSCFETAGRLYQMGFSKEKTKVSLPASFN